MRLGLRSGMSKETLKIDVPSGCTLPQLKQAIKERIGAASASHITVSLNRKNELIGAPDEPLHSLGVDSGDLLFYTADFSVFVPEKQTLGSEAVRSSRFVAALSEVEAFDEEKATEVEGSRFGDEEMADATVLEIEQSGDGVNVEIMDVDVDFAGKRQSRPHFLKNAWMEGRGEVLSGYSLLVVAVQAVLVESGFIRLDSETGSPVYEFQIPNANTLSRPLTLRYTLGELIESKSVAREFVNVKMYKLGCRLSVYGDMTGNRNECFTLRLDVAHYAKNLELELQKSSEYGEDSGGGAGVFSNERHDSEVFRFYKEVKDKLALPLLIEICDKAGLPQPTCSMLLPTELKRNIFELVSGADLAKLACQCLEFQYSTSDNSLWKMKYVKEFGNGGGDDSTNWKLKFVCSWKKAQAMKVRENSYRLNRLSRLNRPLGNHRPPPFGTPFIIGGDFDLHPFGASGPYKAPFGGSSNRQPFFPYPSFQQSRRFSPHRDCDDCDEGSPL